MGGCGMFVSVYPCRCCLLCLLPPTQTHPEVTSGVMLRFHCLTHTHTHTHTHTYTDTHRVMNRAARIASKALSGNVMASEDSWRAVKATAAAATAAARQHAAQALKARSAGRVELKGVGSLHLYNCIWREEGGAVGLPLSGMAGGSTGTGPGAGVLGMLVGSTSRRRSSATASAHLTSRLGQALVSTCSAIDDTQHEDVGADPSYHTTTTATAAGTRPALQSVGVQVQLLQPPVAPPPPDAVAVVPAVGVVAAAPVVEQADASTQTEPARDAA